jgi:hypothetical protein
MSAYIEVDHGEGSPPFSDPIDVHSLTEGSFAFGKDYDVFDALAGGRDAAMARGDPNPSRAPLISPRGMPSPYSPAVASDYFRLVADPPILPDHRFWPEWRCVSSAAAAEWLWERNCQEAEFFQRFNCEPEGRAWRVVSLPGLYNASWLRPDEFSAALEHHSLELATLPVEYRIIRAALSQLVEQHGTERVRLVVWFS